MTDEGKVFAALSEAPVHGTLGGVDFEFYPLTLADRQELSAIVSQIKTDYHAGMTDGEVLSEALRCGAYGSTIARFIAVGAHIRRGSFIERIRKWRIFRAAYRKASSEEVAACFNLVLDSVNPAFFLGIIISLTRQNTLTPTRETDPTVPGL